MSKHVKTYFTDVLVIGSGCGAAGVVPELIKKNYKVLVVEQAGKDRVWGEGLEEKGKRIFKRDGKFPQSEEGVIYYDHQGIGGTLEISCANGVRPSPENLSNIGISIDTELDEVVAEMGINEFPDSHLGDNSKRMISSAESLGYQMQRMPKFINFEKCTKCAMCEVICTKGAKWSTRELFSSLANENKIELVDGVKIESIEMEDGIARAAIGATLEGPIRIEAQSMVLTAGAVGTPIILQNSGFEAGSNFFLDLFVIVYGQSPEFTGGKRDIPMAAFYHHPDDSFVIAPYLDLELWFFLYKRNVSKWLKGENIDGMMVKIKDEAGGRIEKDGTIHKEYTKQDQATMDKGVAIAKQILIKSGCREDSIKVTSPRGAHPGGTAAIGTVVDNNLKVMGTQNLYVADASVFPASPGKPPIVTIIALSKKLGKTMEISDYVEGTAAAV